MSLSATAGNTHVDVYTLPTAPKRTMSLSAALQLYRGQFIKFGATEPNAKVGILKRDDSGSSNENNPSEFLVLKSGNVYIHLSHPKHIIKMLFDLGFNYEDICAGAWGGINDMLLRGCFIDAIHEACDKADEALNDPNVELLYTNGAPTISYGDITVFPRLASLPHNP